MIDEAIAELAPLIGKRAACKATGRPQANHYRRHRRSPKPPRPQRERNVNPPEAWRIRYAASALLASAMNRSYSMGDMPSQALCRRLLL